MERKSTENVLICLDVFLLSAVFHKITKQPLNDQGPVFNLGQV